MHPPQTPPLYLFLDVGDQPMVKSFLLALSPWRPIDAIALASSGRVWRTTRCYRHFPDNIIELRSLGVLKPFPPAPPFSAQSRRFESRWMAFFLLWSSYRLRVSCTMHLWCAGSAITAKAQRYAAFPRTLLLLPLCLYLSMMLSWSQRQK